MSVLPVSAEGVIGSEALQVLPTTRGCHSINPHPTNNFAYAACIAVNADTSEEEGNALYAYTLDAAAAEPLTQLGEPVTPHELVNLVMSGIGLGLGIGLG